MKNIILVFALFVTLAFSNCVVPPNCEIYAASVSACILCSENYILVNNMCFQRNPPQVVRPNTVNTISSGSSTNVVFTPTGTSSTTFSPTTQGVQTNPQTATSTTTATGSFRPVVATTGNPLSIGVNPNLQSQNTYLDDNCKTLH